MEWSLLSPMSTVLEKGVCVLSCGKTVGSMPGCLEGVAGGYEKVLHLRYSEGAVEVGGTVKNKGIML